MKTRTGQIVILALLLAGVYARSADAAIPSELVTCNKAIDHSVRLLNNLACSGNGLRVTDDNITVDLNRHVLSGDGDSGDEGVVINGRSRVTVKNGTILHFETGVHVGASNAITV